MGQLVDGVWRDEQHSERTPGGRFVRPTTRFRNWVTEDGSPGPSGSGGFAAARERYHLYAALPCPWAHRSVIARGLDPTSTPLRDLMTADPICCSPDDSVQAVSELMQAHQIRRVPVVDATGACCGIVAMADLARKAPRQADAGETISEISQPTRAA